MPASTADQDVPLNHNLRGIPHHGGALVLFSRVQCLIFEYLFNPWLLDTDSGIKISKKEHASPKRGSIYYFYVDVTPPPPPPVLEF